MRDVHVVTCFLLRRAEAVDEVLLLRRSERVGTYRGRWAGVSGYVEEGVTALEQAYRETEEEVGLEGSDVRLLAEGEPLIVVDEGIDTRWTVHPFLFELLRSEGVRLDWEHTESRWVRAEEVGTLETVPGLAEALSRVYEGPQAMAEPVQAVVIGAGLRGRDTYGAFALTNPGLLRIVAVAERDGERRSAFARAHDLADERCFDDWRELLERPALSQVAIVATPDDAHAEPALAALAAGYDVLLEKPIAAEAAACAQVVEAFDAAGRRLQIGHCLRYAPFYRAVHEVIASGRLGEVMTISMAENVAHWHMAHSFVRGKFGSTATAAPMLVAKSCHDLDLMVWFVGRPCSRVASFGSLRHFRPESAPPGAPERCTDGCPVEESCLFSAPRFYLRPYPSWPWSDVSLTADMESRRRGLETGPYGRCVYRAGNDVVDHQVVSLEFEGGVTGSFAMHGFAAAPLRTIAVSGTRGELVGAFERGEIRILLHGSGTPEEMRMPYNPVGHGGGDEGLLRHFLEAMQGGGKEELLASGRASLESHLVGFAAERARVEGRVVEMADYRAEVQAGPPARESHGDGV